MKPQPGRRSLPCIPFSLRTGRLFGALALAGATLASQSASAFIEEPETSPRQSSVHYALVRALAVCAGYESDAETVATYSQLTDSLEEDGLTGTLCTSTLPKTATTPRDAAKGGATLKDLIPGIRNGCSDSRNLVYPSSQPASGAGCFTDRFQGYSTFFHMPSSSQLGTIRSWAFTSNVSLRGERFAAYGGVTVTPLTWRCTATWPTETIDTGSVKSGSLEALGIYLHSLADTGSHSDCYSHAVGPDEALDIPTHHGARGEDLCAAMHHADELEVYSTDLNESPLYRTLNATIGTDGVYWLYDDAVPYDQPYDFPGLYTELLSWRNSHSSQFKNHPAALPMDLSNPDYQMLIEMMESMFVDNREAGYQEGGPARVADAQEIEDFCRLAIGE